MGKTPFLFRVLPWVVVLLSPWLAQSPAFAQRIGDIPYAEATFEVSEEPTNVVLQITTSGGLLGFHRSMTVYGDGLVELKKAQKGRILEEHALSIGTTGARDLVKVAVSHGLPEWNSETIRAWMRQKHPAAFDIADGLRVRVSLSLDAYERGSVRRAPLSVSFATKSPTEAAEFYPEILQFRGIHELLEWSSDRWEDPIETSEPRTAELDP